MVRFKLNSKLPIDTLQKLGNKLLLFQSSIIMFSDVQIELEKEKYGIRKKKTRNVSYLKCKLYVYNAVTADVEEINNEHYIKTILSLFDISEMRCDYLTHIKELKVMQSLEEKYNEPSYMEKVDAYLKEGKTLAAVKVFKDATGKSLQESKEHILNIYYTHYKKD